MGKRRAPRIRAAIGAIVTQDDQKEPCLTKSLSTTGLALTSKHPWDPERHVTIDILEEGFRLSIRARIVRQTEATLAVEFDPSGSEAAALMGGLMEALLSRGSPEEVDLSDLDNLEGRVKWTEPDKKSPFNPFAKRFNEGVLADVSHEGALIETRRPPEVGTELVVIFEHDETMQHLIKTHATVVRHTEEGFAVQFDGPSREARSWISKMRSYRRLEEPSTHRLFFRSSPRL